MLLVYPYCNNQSFTFYEKRGRCNVATAGLSKNTTGVAHIFNVSVKSNWRGKGFGRLIMQAAINKAKEMGCTMITLHVHIENSVARNLYLSLGFTVVEKDGYAYLMKLPLI